MPEITVDSLDLFSLDGAVWLVCGATELPNYDFPFDRFFACRRRWLRPDNISAIGRFGVTTNYSQLYTELQTRGVRLIHSPEQYRNDGQESGYAGVPPIGLWNNLIDIERREAGFNYEA